MSVKAKSSSKRKHKLWYSKKSGKIVHSWPTYRSVEHCIIMRVGKVASGQSGLEISLLLNVYMLFIVTVHDKNIGKMENSLNIWFEAQTRKKIS